MTRDFFHATLHDHVASIKRHGIIPMRGPFASLAHSQPCPEHPSQSRVYVSPGIDEGLLSALCFHVVRRIERKLDVDDAFVTDHFEEGWLTARDIGVFGAVVQVDACEDEVFHQREVSCTAKCLEADDHYLLRTVNPRRTLTGADLVNLLESRDLIRFYTQFLRADRGGRRRMNDGMYLVEFRPARLRPRCRTADAAMRNLRARYGQIMEDRLYFGR